MSAQDGSLALPCKQDRARCLIVRMVVVVIIRRSAPPEHCNCCHHSGQQCGHGAHPLRPYHFFSFLPVPGAGPGRQGRKKADTKRIGWSKNHATDQLAPDEAGRMACRSQARPTARTTPTHLANCACGHCVPALRAGALLASPDAQNPLLKGVPDLMGTWQVTAITRQGP
jgi:hypothetical protein